MARMDTMTTAITTPMTVEEAMAAISAMLHQYGATPARGDETTIQAKSGKKTGTRLLGAMFVPEEWLPLHYTITFVEGDGATRVEISVQDDFGMGVRSGFKNKYEILMKRRLGELTGALR
jgi:hypothetical protein